MYIFSPYNVGIESFLKKIIAGLVVDKFLSQRKIRKLTKENELLKEKLRTTELDSATKQKIIIESDYIIRELQAELDREKRRNFANRKIISELETLIYSLKETKNMVS